jgi:hypothetical protein
VQLPVGDLGEVLQDRVEYLDRHVHALDAGGEDAEAAVAVVLG